ncbi:hypothetical protein ABNQ39_00320 (plasmid) [Azospirillum sp. A26]|uniref:hypothetical protein n=1 Tax=Azospirillum sp. A26 TaxID=3160607 RepID=UPI00366FC2BB
MTDTSTAPTPEELAARVELVGTEAAQAEIREDIAAAIRQHSEALEARIAELTADLDMVQRELAVRTDECVTAEARATTAEAALAAMTAERDKLREALEREAAWNEAEAAICDQQAAAALTGSDAPNKPFFEGAAHTHRKAARRLSAAIQPQEPANG